LKEKKSIKKKSQKKRWEKSTGKLASPAGQEVLSDLTLTVELEAIVWMLEEEGLELKL